MQVQRVIILLGSLFFVTSTSMGHCLVPENPVFSQSCHDADGEVRVEAAVYSSDDPRNCPSTIKVWLTDEVDGEKLITDSIGGLAIYRKELGEPLEILFAFPSQNHFSFIPKMKTAFIEYGGGPSWTLKCK